MQITATFENIEEMKDFVAKVAVLEGGADKPAVQVPQERKTPKKAAQPEEQTAVSSEQTEETTGEEPAAEEAPDYKLEDVRAKLAELNKAGKCAQVKDLLAGFGVEKLSEIPAEKYSELMEKAGEL